MTREEIKEGPIYIKNPSHVASGTFVAINYHSNGVLIPDTATRLSDGTYTNGKAFYVGNSKINNSTNFSELVDKALDKLIDSLEDTPGLDTILSIDHLIPSKFTKLWKDKK